ncbi:MAG: hypothetical protein VX899_10715 [Myxococcota bacterium]|nr:hypothetical protein [Myxococcota bacterium]
MHKAPTPRLIILDDGPPGALEALLGRELPETLALVSSVRPRPAGLRKGVWMSDSKLHELLPETGPVRIRATSDLDWQILLDAEILREVVPPASAQVALAVALQILGQPGPRTRPHDRVLQAWEAAVAAWNRRDLDGAREAITLVNRRWPTWKPGWSFADEVYTSLGMFEIAVACRCRSGEPPLFRLRSPKPLRKVA